MDAKIAITALIAVFSISALSGADNAYAASSYDNTIRTKNTVTLVSPDGTQVVDFTNTWHGSLNDDTSSTCDAVFDDLYNLDRDAGGMYSITDFKYSGLKRGFWLMYGYEGLMYFHGTEPSSYVGGPAVNSSLPYGGAFAVIENNGDIVWQCSDTSYQLSGGTMSTGSGHSLDAYVIESTWDIDYPIGYEGETPSAGRTTLEFAPDWQVLGTIDWEGTFSDANFATFDDVLPFTCSEGLTPAVSWNMHDDTNGIDRDSGIMNASGQINYKFEKVPEERIYTLSGIYTCGDEDTEPIFSEYGTYTFTISTFGTLDRELFGNCMTETFPFFDSDECVSNVYKAVNLLSFNTIGFGNSWDSADGCYTLVTLGNWLNLDESEKTLCPQFPSVVRNTVTPFVSMFLGIVTVSFLARNKGSNW